MEYRRIAYAVGTEGYTVTDAELTLDALERLGGKCITFYVGPGGDDGNWGRSWKDRLETTAEGIKRAWAGDRIVFSSNSKGIKVIR